MTGLRGGPNSMEASSAVVIGRGKPSQMPEPVELGGLYFIDGCTDFVAETQKVVFLSADDMV